MASSGYLSFFSLIVSLAVIQLVLSTPSLARPAFHVEVSSADVEAICKSTQYPSYCLKLLKSNPKVGSVDLPGLAGILAGIASDMVKDTSAYIKQLLKKAPSKPQPGGGPSLKERYLTCAENYDAASDDVQQINGDISSKDYFGAQTAASALLDEPDTCDEELQPDPSQLAQRNQDLKSVADIILAITARLRGQIV